MAHRQSARPVRRPGRLTVLSAAPQLSDYDRIVVAFSGGKDSAACVLALLEAGADPRRIELHHHDIDGNETFMDWPITPAYCEAFADVLGLPLYRSGRIGGFSRELERNGVPSAPIVYELPDGTVERSCGRGPPGERGRFPQVTADLRLRWCSAVLKIEVMDALIRGQARFLEGRTLVVTGERGEESPSRAKYAAFTPHRTSCRSRQVDHWRPVHDWPEARVWDVLRAAGLEVHPAYRLGFSCVSCRFCIFLGPDALATLTHLYPDDFARVAAREATSGWTIKRHHSLGAQASRGTPFSAAVSQPQLARIAGGRRWTMPMRPKEWTLPAGAFESSGGPP